MADFKFGEGRNQTVTDSNNHEEYNNANIIEDTIIRPRNDRGLSEEERADANKVRVSVLDYRTPILILFGPQSCGKTMTLIRLTAYLRKSGYEVSPITTFRPSDDTHYEEMCDNFDDFVNSENAVDSTALLNFMLVKVSMQGKTICQILESPGEYYFNTQQPRQKFPRFINNIISSPNRKIWAIMLEPDCKTSVMTQSLRVAYVEKINMLKRQLSVHDKVIFVLNKIDETNLVLRPGVVNMAQALKEIEYLYPGIFSQFKNQNPITKIFKPTNCDFIPFQTGYYSEFDDGSGLAYEHAHDAYPANFWNLILKRIKG